MTSSKVNRRKFLKCIGAGVASVGATAAGYYLYDMGLARRKGVAVQIVAQTAKTVDYPPYADFKYKPCYLCPTDEQTVRFTNMSYDLGGDPLTHTWLIDNKEVSHERDYSTKLPQGEHVVDLRVSDGKQTKAKSATVTVEPDQTYPLGQLRIKRKGICYCAGRIAPEWSSNPNPSREEMDEQLDTIHNELGCNAIVIMAGGDHEDELIECGRLAIEKRFDHIYIGPEYMGASPDETVERLGSFAPRVRELREASESIVFLVGHEFGLETAIVRGNDWFERLATLNKGMDWDKVVHVLPTMFSKIIQVCKKEYGYQIAYRAIATEVDLVPWENPIFESVGVDAYLQESTGWTEDWIIGLLSRLKSYRKPVQSTEAGCETFTGAGRIGGNILWGVWEKPYDEDEQAKYIRRYCDMLNRARIDGYYYTVYNDDFDKTYGLYNPVTRKRKKGFYMYKSYQRTS